MGADQFVLELDNPLKSYFPGNVISGKLVLNCSSSQKCQGIKVKLEGKAVVRWSETKQQPATTAKDGHRKNNTKTVVYRSDETYLQYKHYVVGDGNSQTVLPVGRSEFPFSFILPNGLPSSFVSQYGNVTYWAEAVMKRSWNFDKKVKVPFTVNALVDLNNTPNASTPGQLSTSKQVGMLCCVGGNIDVVVSTTKMGFVCGEMMDIEAEIRNQSNKDVNSVNLSLIQVRQYHAQGKSRTDTAVLGSVTRPGAKRFSSEVTRGQAMQIPAVPPSGLGNCKIIDVSYKLHVEACLSGMAINMRGDIPIIIGTIPLRVNFPDLAPWSPPAQNRNDTNDFENSNAFAPSAPALLMEDYRDLPPPTYEDAIRYDPYVFIPDREGDTNDAGAGDSGNNGYDSNFVPKYATWGFRKK